MKLREIEAKYKIMENSCTIFQIKEAVGRSHIFFKKYMFFKISQISQETPVLESLFKKVSGLKSYATLLKRDSNTVFFLQNF